MTNYYNSTDSQIVVDSQGHIIAGGEWADLDDSPQVRRAVEAGELVEVEQMPPEEPEVGPEAEVPDDEPKTSEASKKATKSR